MIEGTRPLSLRLANRRATCPFLSLRVLFCILLANWLVACSEPNPVVHSVAPTRLSEWQLFSLTDEVLQPATSTLVFRPASTLFSDYAQKLRSLWIPEGSQIRVQAGEFVFPVGTVLSKTFYYPAAEGTRVEQRDEQSARVIDLHENRVLETRLLVRRSDDWEALPYVWNAEESEAFLRVAGTSTALTLAAADGEQDFSYFVPNQNQCSACHQTEHPDGQLKPLGARLKQLNYNSGMPREESPLAELVARGWLPALPDTEQPVDWSDQEQPIDARALAYLNMNCGHCHNPQGAADTSALLLDGSHNSLTELGVCKPPVAAGGGAGDLRFGIVPGAADASILLYRMRSTAPDEMMPELGRSLVHDEGIALLQQWIDAMSTPICPEPRSSSDL